LKNQTSLGALIINNHQSTILLSQVKPHLVAVVEAALALLFFMHLAENRGLLWFVVVFTVSVLLTMQYGWTDAFRLSAGAPWAK